MTGDCIIHRVRQTNDRIEILVLKNPRDKFKVSIVASHVQLHGQLHGSTVVVNPKRDLRIQAGDLYFQFAVCWNMVHFLWPDERAFTTKLNCHRKRFRDRISVTFRERILG